MSKNPWHSSEISILISSAFLFLCFPSSNLEMIIYLHIPVIIVLAFLNTYKDLKVAYFSKIYYRTSLYIKIDFVMSMTDYE
jgi:hypothetical protein